MRAFYCDHFTLPLPIGHRFPIEKYARLRERVILEGTADLAVPGAATDEQLLRVHDPEYVARVTAGGLTAAEVRRIGFPWSPGLVERSRRSVGGTVAAAMAALDDGVSANLAGGTHHAFSDRGEGFCVFNDVAVAVRELQAAGHAKRASILDLDVHQGNGTASIFAHDERVFTLSVHGRNNFPFRKEASDLDIELEDGCRDEEYLLAVERGLEAALASAPDVAFYVAGADPHERDRLGRLSVTAHGLAQRDRLVLDTCGRVGIPVVIVMSGGYGHDLSDTVSIHFETLRVAATRARNGAHA